MRGFLVLIFGFLMFISACKSSNSVSYVRENRNIYQAEQEQDTITLPPSLRPGDTVMIIAPAGYVSNRNDYIGRGDSLMRAWGLVPVHGKHLFDKHFHFAGTDSARLEDLQRALDDPSVKAIWAARGGYGSIRIIHDVDWTKFKQNPKWLIGFSDITVIHAALFKQGFASVHGIMPISLTHPNPERKPAIVTLKNVLFGKKLRFSIPSDSMNIQGRGEGIIVGGNLSMLVSMLGSGLQIDTDGKILFLEDVDEYPYSYDKMLYALANAGYFDHLAGLIVGDMHTKKNADPFGESVEEMVLKHVRGKGYPVVFHFPAGHVVKNYAIVFGKKAKLKVGSKKVIISY